ncbi:MAG: DNA-binding response regulator [Gemmatales bacterium]|nr:MAG: DNA-binding response regulator [Gemmatales bacterium]
MIRVLLADNRKLVRAGMRVILRGFRGIELVGEAGDGRAALRKIKSLRPHVAVMRIAMTGMNGLEATCRAARRFPQVGIVLFSSYNNETTVWQAFQAGANAFVSLDAEPADLREAIESASRGHAYVGPGLPARLVRDILQNARAKESPLDLLTPRQREVLQLIVEGHSTKNIARMVKLGIKTVETHRQQLMKRLHIYDVPGLVRFALRTGLITGDLP